MITARSRTALDERPLSVMVEWCGAHLPTLMGFAAYSKPVTRRSHIAGQDKSSSI